MDTVRTTAALLPDLAELRAHLRALAVLDQAICRDPRFSRYSFSTAWGPGTEAALMDNGSGIEFPSGSPDPDGSGHLFRRCRTRSARSGRPYGSCS
ncbi:hypothetical protein [Streptomyces sp. NPDC057494]|uniref:hypothetical protein n=1 Tax=Streptomyces sp. NPDC057494 TaxID=3346148 RepID=UPI0036931E77